MIAVILVVLSIGCLCLSILYAGSRMENDELKDALAAYSSNPNFPKVDQTLPPPIEEHELGFTQDVDLSPKILDQINARIHYTDNEPD